MAGWATWRSVWRIALAIGMKTGANLLQFGETLKEEMSRLIAEDARTAQAKAGTDRDEKI